LGLAGREVAVITGGARGVTAAAAIALAQRTGCTAILIGRSAPLQSEPDWMESLTDEAALKKAILKYRFKGKASPRDIETEYRHIVSGRSINQTIQAIEKAGGRAAYFPADVRDEKEIRGLMERIRTEYGPIRAVLHGAGVLEDRLITDKTVEQFRRVFHTKVTGLVALLNATAADSLKYLVLFSSVSARAGNRGQVDYAMANEVLNKLARAYAYDHVDCKVAAINWGPWDGGMVSPALKKEFQRQGVELIPIAGGVERMLQEMAAPPGAAVETVIGPVFNQPLATRIDRKREDHQADDLALLVKHQVDTKGYPVLASHILAGRPVVPFSLIAEWLGHGALHDNPGLFLHGLDDMRLFNGIKLDKETKTIRLMAGKAVKDAHTFAVDVQIRNGLHPDGSEFIHSSARAILTDRWITPPQLNGEADIAVQPYHRDLNEVYEKILFHGNHLRGITHIAGYSDQGIIADVATAPSPMTWIAHPLRSRWIADPLVLDSAFQLAIVWCYETKGLVSLPSYAASYRQYRDRFPADGVRAILKVNQATANKMTGDFTFIDANNEIIAKLNGYEAVMDTGLQRAFNNRTRDAA
jgi:NAD(P)-dependent dehydrogenase (short-subunit alcohol dehydrogenase family)